jgi:hypothetical protein
MKHPYERSAAADDIRKSFQLLAEKLHPDANKHDPNAAEHITVGKPAHEMLGDEAKDRVFGGGETFHRAEFDAESNRMPKEVAVAISGVTLSVTGLLVALAILVASPLITQSLMPLTGIYANKDGGDPTPTLEPIESAGPRAASVPGSAKAPSDSPVDKGVATATPTDQIAALDAIEGKGEHDPIGLLIGRSEKLLSEGQVEAARLLLLPAAEAHDARAALALGATYDPIMLAIFQAHAVAADVSMALDWYKKASEFGSRKAQQRLNLLTAALSRSKSTAGMDASENAPPKVMATPMARPKGHVARAPTHQHSPDKGYRVDVAGVGTNPDPLLSPPAFIQ